MPFKGLKLPVIFFQGVTLRKLQHRPKIFFSQPYAILADDCHLVSEVGVGLWLLLSYLHGRLHWVKVGSTQSSMCNTASD